MANIDSSMIAVGSRKGILQGNKGYIVVGNINNPCSIKVFDSDHRQVNELTIPQQLTGYEYQVASAAKAILEDKKECEEMPHSETLRMMRIMDDLRAQWGEVYPFES